MKSQAAQEVKVRALGTESDPMACSEFEPDAALSDVLDELRTLPLLTAYRLVVVVDADAFIRRHREALEQYCRHPSSSAGLLMICDRFDRRTRLYKAVERIGQVIECGPMKGAAVTGWISRRAQTAYGKTLDNRTAANLRRLCGDTLAILDNELFKLSIYVGQRKAISAADVDVLVGNNREEKVFGIAEALARGDAAGALQLWEQAWRTERAAPARAVGGLAWAIRRNLEGKIKVAQGVPYGQVAKVFWKDPRYVQSLLGGVSLGELEEQLRELHRADLDIKTGLSRNLQLAVEKLIISRCELARAG